MGEFAKIKDSLEAISVELNGAMGQLQAASQDVAAGAQQVSNGAVTLSQGAQKANDITRESIRFPW